MTAPESSHAERLIETFASLADTLVAGYDLVDLLQTLVERCADLLDVDAANILLADESGELEVVAATSEVSRIWLRRCRSVRRGRSMYSRVT